MLPDNVKLISFCLGGSRDKSAVKKLLEEAGFEGITLIGGDGDLEKFMYELRYTPTTVFVDSEGNMAAEAIVGVTDSLSLDFTKKINAVLESAGKEKLTYEGEQTAED